MSEILLVGCRWCKLICGQSTVDNKQTCKMCDQGKRQTVSNVYSDIACTDCPLGTTSDNSGIACDVCPSAKYSSVLNFNLQLMVTKPRIFMPTCCLKFRMKFICVCCLKLEDEEKIWHQDAWPIHVIFGEFVNCCVIVWKR